MDDDCRLDTVEVGAPTVGEDVGALSDDQLIRCKDAMETIYLDRPSNRQARRLLRKAIREVIANRRADLPPGTDRDGVVIAVHGESRSGKTALVNRLLAGEQRLASPSDGHTKLVVNIQVKGPATLKSAGLQILEALGYKPAGKMDEAPVWDRVYTQLRLCNSLVLHLGEMSNISRTLNVTERVKLRDTIKSIAINELHPMVVIVSGLPDIMPFLQADDQLLERLLSIGVERLQPDHVEPLAKGVAMVAETIGLAVDEDDVRDEIVPRLMYACKYRLGSCMEFIIDAALQALEPLDDRDRRTAPEGTLGIRHFALEYAEQTGNADWANPFVITDWESLNVDSKGVIFPYQFDDEPDEVDLPRKKGKPRKTGGTA